MKLKLTLEEALGDGFGDRGALGSRPLPLPPEIKSGLLQHSFFVPAHFSQSGHEEKYGDKESNDLFWMIGPDDQPAPFERLPLGFVLRRLWLYFDNQFDRFANTLAREQPENTSLTRLELENLAQYRMFEKPWYEFHAVQLINWIQDAHSDEVNKKEQINLWSLILLSFSGELGRLVEQYYWRFRFEKAAVTGVGARKAASLEARRSPKSTRHNSPSGNDGRQIFWDVTPS